MWLDMSVSDELRRAIQRDGRSVYALAHEAGLSAIQIWRFLRDERGLTTPAVDQLCDVLGLELRPRRPRRKGR
jgi:hypothetical protein